MRRRAVVLRLALVHLGRIRQLGVLVRLGRGLQLLWVGARLGAAVVLGALLLGAVVGVAAGVVLIGRLVAALGRVVVLLACVRSGSSPSWSA